MDAWLKEAKAHESAEKIGMYLTHNGIVRKSANGQKGQSQKQECALQTRNLPRKDSDDRT